MMAFSFRPIRVDVAFPIVESFNKEGSLAFGTRF